MRHLRGGDHGRDDERDGDEHDCSRNLLLGDRGDGDDRDGDDRGDRDRSRILLLVHDDYVVHDIFVILDLVCS